MALQFQPISMEQQTQYQDRFSRCSQTASDYSFINLWGWADHYGLQWAWTDELVWIKQEHPEQSLWAPVGDWQRIDWTDTLAQVKQEYLKIIRVPQDLSRIWRQSSLHSEIQETREHWDYLYDVQELINLRGNRFHKKKNLMSQFKKKYEFTYLPLGQDMAAQALNMQENWCVWRDCESNDTLEAENHAIVRVLKHWQKLDRISGAALRVDDNLAAYTIAERLSNDTIVIHFEKGDPRYKGSYQAINQLFLEQGASDCTFVNREQDLGDEGLRKAKLSYHPVDFVRKYGIIF